MMDLAPIILAYLIYLFIVIVIVILIRLFIRNHKEYKDMQRKRQDSLDKIHEEIKKLNEK
ncbi:hypothetical protein DX933_07355 [Ornithinibacillus gellani]|uniref:hypothetical protein n=1 Tax=Ornithinibacillus gellani TaxID=2293253 RepID=UPI000F485ECA|nr:hypothetical protein [Ornithinibacillus gellani]TQS75273.1 hypothetical protein DX933_07355 [Ornithinibacillus gellani]